MRQPIQILAIIAMMGYSVNAYGEEGYVSGLIRLRELAQKKSISAQELAEARTILAQVKADAPKGRRDIADSLLSVVKDGKDNVIGPLAIPIACEKADAQGADKLVEYIHGLVEEMQKRPPTNKDRSTTGVAAVVNAFFEDGAASIAHITTQPRRLLDIVIANTTAPTPLLRPDVRQKALALIAENAIAPAIRREYALRFISLRPREPAPDGFAQFFSAEDFPKLRTLVGAPNDTAETFSYGAADILAHHGDEDVLPALKDFLNKHAAGKPTPEGMIKWNIWQIENQHPATKLLVYIRGSERLASDGRIWAMKRAIELKLDKKDIRDAILAHAEAVKDDRVQMSDLVVLKKVAIEIGVLNVNDLPAVVAVKGPYEGG